MTFIHAARARLSSRIHGNPAADPKIRRPHIQLDSRPSLGAKPLACGSGRLPARTQTAETHCGDGSLGSMAPGNFRFSASLAEPRDFAWNASPVNRSFFSCSETAAWPSFRAAVAFTQSRHPEWAELACIAERLFAVFFLVEPVIRPQLNAAMLIRVPLQPCKITRHSGCGAMLFAGDRVSGIVDFGAMRFETVAGDVARLLDSLAGRRFDDVAKRAGRLSNDPTTLRRRIDARAGLRSLRTAAGGTQLDPD